MGSNQRGKQRRVTEQQQTGNQKGKTALMLFNVVPWSYEMYIVHKRIYNTHNVYKYRKCVFLRKFLFDVQMKGKIQLKCENTCECIHTYSINWTLNHSHILCEY